MATPYISRKDVGAALNALIYTTRDPDFAVLSRLLIVDLRLSAPAMLKGDEARNFVVRELLTIEISNALDVHRTRFGLPSADSQESLDQARASIAADLGVSRSSLLTWSILYYRYVRADLSFSIEELAQLYSVEPRTINRYVTHAVGELTQRLIRAEAAARRAQRRRWLLAALPLSVDPPLYGREQLLAELVDLLPSLRPCHILVTGANGVGKTVLVQVGMRQLIDADRLDQLVWLESPPSVQYVRERLIETLLKEVGGVSLREYMLMYRVGVVVDGMAAFSAEIDALNALLDDLGAGLVVMINISVMAIERFTLHLALPEIAQGDAERLLYEIFLHHPLVDLEADDLLNTVHELALQVGGNPLALKLAADIWDMLDWTVLRQDVEGKLLNRAFDALDTPQQAIWGALALFAGPVAAAELGLLWGFDAQAVLTFTRLNVVEVTDAGYRLVGAAKDYLRNQYDRSAQVQNLVDRLIEQMNVHVTGTALDAIEQILLTDFPPLSADRQVEWIRSYWRAGLQRGGLAVWSTILERYTQRHADAEAEFRIGYGVCLRRLGDWAGAQQVFYQVASDCGRMGQFHEQAHALIEWGILAKYQGEFSEASALFSQAKRYVVRAQAGDLLTTLTLQEAQLLLEQNLSEDAYKLLAELPESAQTLTLQSEAQLAMGNFELCESLVSRAYTLVGEDGVTAASLYTIAGRANDAKGDLEGARRYFTQVVTLLERSGDVFALARAKMNLAAVLIRLGSRHDADALLADAAQVQARLGDRVGLEVTRHNRDWLDKP